MSNWNSNAANTTKLWQFTLLSRKKLTNNNMYNRPNASITKIHYSTTEMGLALPMYWLLSWGTCRITQMFTLLAITCIINSETRGRHCLRPLSRKRVTYRQGYTPSTVGEACIRTDTSTSIVRENVRNTAKKTWKVMTFWMHFQKNVKKT